jgi:uncharacterized protein (DUF608 family)
MGSKNNAFMFYTNKLLRLVVACCCLSAFVFSSTEAFTINGTASTTRLEGVPLGGIGAGCFNFLPNGTYNRDWVQTQPPTGMEPTIMVYTKSGTTTWSTQALTTAAGMGITYTGYWPTVTNVYTNASLKINLTLDAFSPLFPGSSKDCSMPLAFFVFTLENTTAAAVTAAIACKNNATASVITNGGKVQGIAGNNITMMVKNSDTTAQVTSGATVSDFTADGLLSNVAGGILASEVVLQPSEKKTTTFVVAWDNIDGYYRKWLTTSRNIAQYGYDSAEVLKAKVDNWHNKILNSNLPDWYKDVLINNFHVFNSMYEWHSDGYCGQTESMSDKGSTGCFDMRYYSSIPLPLFAPDAEFLEMKGFANLQNPDGQIWHGLNDNGAKSDINAEFPLCLLRDYLWTGERRFLDSMYVNAKKALAKNNTVDTDQDGLCNNGFTTFDTQFETGWMPGEPEYPSDIQLAGIKSVQKMADLMSDTKMVDTCKAWYAKTSATFEKPAGQHGYWNTTNAGPTGLKGYYTGSNDLTSNGGVGIASWASQLSGQWYADLLQLGLLHPQGRIDSVIAFIDACNKGSRGDFLAIFPDHSRWFCMPGANSHSGEQWPWFPPTHFGCPAISHGFPDIGMACVNRNWKAIYSGEVTSVGPIPWNSPVFMNVDGTDAPDTWGRYRYMDPPGVFASLMAITGFSVDIPGQEIWIKPSLPTSLNNKLIKAPLINGLSCGTLDYEAKSPYGQVMTIIFDSNMRFTHVIIKDQNTTITPSVIVTKNSFAVACTVTRQGSGKSAELDLAFDSNGLVIDQNGVTITVNGDVSTRSSMHPDFAGRKMKVFKSINSNFSQITKGYSQNDIVEVYDLQGKLLVSTKIKKLPALAKELSFVPHLYKIKPVY